jgi:hypothetical protein
LGICASFEDQAEVRAANQIPLGGEGLQYGRRRLLRRMIFMTHTRI